MMGWMSNTLRRSAFRAWASERGLDAEDERAFRGTFGDVPRVLDTGIRDSGAYDVVARISIACGVAPIVIKDPAPNVEHRVARAIRELVGDGDLRSAFIGEDFVELRFPSTTPLDHIERALEAVTAAWHSPDETRSAYR